MTVPTNDERSSGRRARDERIAAEPRLDPPPLPSDAQALPMEARLAHQGRGPRAVAGVVENGVVRPLDPTVRLAERSRVIIVTSEGAEA